MALDAAWLDAVSKGPAPDPPPEPEYVPGTLSAGLRRLAEESKAGLWKGMLRRKDIQ